MLSSDYRIQYSATTIVNSKRIITLMNQNNVLSAELSTIWQNKDGCTYHYICDTALYLMPMLSQDFSLIIDRDISATIYVR